MSVYSGVRTAIRNSALAALSEFPTTPVVFSHSGGSEPAESYVVVNILSIEQQGHHMTSTLTNVDEELSIQVAYELLCQFSFIGSLSGDMAHRFAQRINNNPVALEEIKKNNLGIMRKSQIRRAPQKRDTKWVEYHNMDVTFNYITNTQQLVDVIDGIVVESNLDDDPDLIKIPESIIYP